MGLNIAVCIKPVPDPDKYNLLEIDPVTKRLVREGIPNIINPADKNALEEALQIKEKHGGKVTVISMAPPQGIDKLKECLAMGADAAFLLSDRAFGGADTLATSYTLSRGLQKLGKFDLVLAGHDSADGATSHVPSQLGEWLEYAHIIGVQKLDIVDDKAFVRRKIENGYMEYEVRLPAVIAVERGMNTPRYISAMGVIKAKRKPLVIYGVEDMCINEKYIGFNGSPTQPGNIYTMDVERESVLIDGDYEEIAKKTVAILRKAGANV